MNSKIFIFFLEERKSSQNENKTWVALKILLIQGNFLIFPRGNQHVFLSFLDFDSLSYRNLHKPWIPNDHSKWTNLIQFEKLSKSALDFFGTIFRVRSILLISRMKFWILRPKLRSDEESGEILGIRDLGNLYFDTLFNFPIEINFAHFKKKILNFRTQMEPD